MDGTEEQYELLRELEKVDRRIRIECLKREVEEICGGELVVSGGDEDIEIGLKFYDDEEERVHWRESFPEDPIPDHEVPPCDRDRHLPKRDYG